MSTVAARVTTPANRTIDLRRTWVAARQRWLLVIACLFVLLAVPSDGYLGPARVTFALSQAIDGLGFRLAAWETQALRQKAQDLITRPGASLTAQEQHDLVVAYFDAIEQIGDLTGEIEGVYADPSIQDPAQAAAPLQAELDGLREEQARRRPAVERILEQQIGAVLSEVGLTTAGQIWPPVRFQFTESPYYLIVSPRDRIAIERGVYLDPTLPVSRMEGIETQVEDRLNVSALVEGTGGFSSYPTMVIEHSNLEWVLSTIAHEWTHTYLIFHPLGWHYSDNSDTRTLNETTASIVGDEIGQLAMLRFYPEQVPPARWPRPLTTEPDWWQEQPENRPFEFGAFMRETRLQVDKLLAEGRVTEAENFMEARRKMLLARGYIIRKLNQAYFAFHGSYAVGPSATDPIGGELRALRQRAGNLAEFVRVVAHITDVAGLTAALQQFGTVTPSSGG